VCYVVGLSSLSKVKKFLFFFLSQQGGEGCVFAVFFAPIPEKGISDFIAHGSIIQVFTVEETCARTLEFPFSATRGENTANSALTVETK